MRTYTYPLVFNVLAGIAVTGSPLWLLHWKKGQKECFLVLFTATGYKAMLRFRLFFLPACCQDLSNASIALSILPTVVEHQSSGGSGATIVTASRLLRKLPLNSLNSTGYLKPSALQSLPFLDQLEHTFTRPYRLLLSSRSTSAVVLSIAPVAAAGKIQQARTHTFTRKLQNWTIQSDFD